LLISRPVAKRDCRGPREIGWPQGKTLFEGKENEMLVLSRKVGERIHVGDNIVLEIRRIAGNRVTLALDAPRSVRILRGELEGAAREFRPPTEACPPGERPAASQTAPNANGVTMLNHIPVQHVGHSCAT
jgi:carbon storage regulator